MIEAGDAVFRGVSADAFVDYVIVVSSGVEFRLKVIGIALAGVGSVAGGETVAETGNDWASI